MSARSPSSGAARSWLLIFGIPPLIIGLTIVAFGTSAPELTVSISAALKGASDVAVGNVIGSNIFNIAVISGITAMIRPPSVHLDLIRREIPVLILVTLLGGGLILFGKISRTTGILLFIALCVEPQMPPRRAVSAYSKGYGVSDQWLTQLQACQSQSYRQGSQTAVFTILRKLCLTFGQGSGFAAALAWCSLPLSSHGCCDSSLPDVVSSKCNTMSSSTANQGRDSSKKKSHGPA